MRPVGPMGFWEDEGEEDGYMCVCVCVWVGGNGWWIGGIVERERGIRNGKETSVEVKRRMLDEEKSKRYD